MEPASNEARNLLKSAPLSERPLEPGATIPDKNIADNMTLYKTTPRADTEEEVTKDPNLLIQDTKNLIQFAKCQSKEQKDINNELKALLEHEKKILLLMLERSTKFTNMKEENKKRTDDWEAEHKQRLPFYCQYLKQLIELPENQQSVSQEGVPGQVQQGILYTIVENTCNIANNAMVQLYMHNTLVNDAEMNMSNLRIFEPLEFFLEEEILREDQIGQLCLTCRALTSQTCTVIIKQIDNWLKMLNTQSENQTRVHDQWDALTNTVKNLEEYKNEDQVSDIGAVSLATDLQSMMNTLDGRLAKLEDCVKEITSQSIFPGSLIQQNQSRPQPATRPASPYPCPPLPQSFPTGTNRPPPVQCVPNAPPKQNFPTGEDYFGIPQTPPPPGSSQPVGTAFPFPASPGQTVPRTQPTPAQQYGRFQPMASSSVVGSQRDFPAYSQPPPSQMGPPIDPALLPKIQQDLQNLSKRNKHLQDLVGNFRKLRGLLTEELNDAVQLNQKLQRDLYYISQEAQKQAQ